MAQKSISDEFFKIDCGVINWLFLLQRCQKKHNEWGYDILKYGWFLENGVPSTFRLLHCYVVLWIHVIVAICMKNCDDFVSLSRVEIFQLKTVISCTRDYDGTNSFEVIFFVLLEVILYYFFWLSIPFLLTFSEIHTKNGNW